MIDRLLVVVGIASGLALVGLGAYHDQGSVMAVGTLAVAAAILHAHAPNG